MRRAAILLLGAILTTGSAYASSAALEAAKQAVEKADYRASGHLVQVDANGTRTSYPVSFKAHWFSGVLKIFMQVGAAPGGQHAPVNILLEMRPDGANSIVVAHPGTPTTAALPESDWSAGVNGTGFSFEDFLEGQFFWAGQAVTEHVKYGARDCDLVKSTPGPADRTRYSLVSSWVDRATGFAVYQEKVLKGSGTVKEFTAFGLRHDGGVWSATQIEEKNRGQGGSTLLIIDRGSTKANLVAADFSLSRLTHF